MHTQNKVDVHTPTVIVQHLRTHCNSQRQIRRKIFIVRNNGFFHILHQTNLGSVAHCSRSSLLGLVYDARNFRCEPRSTDAEFRRKTRKGRRGIEKMGEKRGRMGISRFLFSGLCRVLQSYTLSGRMNCVRSIPMKMSLLVTFKGELLGGLKR